MKKFIFPLLLASTCFANHAQAYTYVADNLTLTGLGWFDDHGFLWPDDLEGLETQPATVMISFDDDFLKYNSTASASVYIEEWGNESTRAMKPLAKNFTWDTAGNLIGWDLKFFYEEGTFSSTTGDGHFEIIFESSYGEATCNCDTYIHKFDLFTGGGDRYKWVGQRGIVYHAEPSLTNWLDAPTAQPSANLLEPSSLFLLFSGLLIAGAVRLKSFNIFN